MNKAATLLSSPEFWKQEDQSLRFRVYCKDCSFGKDTVACADDVTLFLEKHREHQTVFFTSKKRSVNV